MTRWESFTRLVREGRTPEEISLTFGLTELQVKRTLALGNLLPHIRTLYRRGKIDVATVRHLTLASKTQQRDWLALVDDESSYCPTGFQLKARLFGDVSIPTGAALFDLASYQGEIVSDLFGDDRYFASASDFWTAQTAAIEERAEGESLDKAVRPEITAPIHNYIDLHRHAAVRAEVAERPAIALRLIGGARDCRLDPVPRAPEPQRAHSDAIAESVETCPARQRSMPSAGRCWA